MRKRLSHGAQFLRRNFGIFFTFPCEPVIIWQTGNRKSKGADVIPGGGQNRATLLGPGGLASLLLMSGCIGSGPDALQGPSQPTLTSDSIRLVTRESGMESPFAAAASAYVFVFARIDCPISNRYAPEIRDLAEAYTPRGVKFALVYANPRTTWQAIEKHMGEFHYPGRAWRDPKHELVSLAGAKVTPEAAVFDAQRKLLYCGRIDDRYVNLGTRRNDATTQDLAEAINHALFGTSDDCVRTKAVGCYIGDLR